MTLTAWQTYLAVCRLGSLTAAASELGYTQSAVSRQIHTIERLAGVPLLRRHARGVAPTAAGDAFRHHARVVVTEADRAVRSARAAAAGPDAHTLAVGATPSTAASIVPAALRELPGDGDQVIWTLLPGLTAELEVMVGAGDLDVAVVTDAPPGLTDDPRLVRHPVGVDEMCVIVPAGHRCAGLDEVSIGEFIGETWVEDNDGSAALLRRTAVRAGFEPRIDMAAVDLMGKMALVAAGHAVALIPGVMAPTVRRDVSTVRLADPPRRGIYATVPVVAARGAPAAMAFVDRLTATLNAWHPHPMIMNTCPCHGTDKCS
ncbi:LysR family transcriptional regulator [Phytoactinopolyspora limicola]|uniref:LysR family transcriptional regulator n=1 Tax=Phytoactinopolyspora limicola TaxID=2715536 RepID=UPI00140B3CC3|nr:LysR family transcriptional regulator [Phytoactinopolyspora limicola]